MRAVVMLALMALLVAACSPAASGPTPLPGLTGSVMITYPPDGTTVYAEAIYVQGSAQGVPNNTFALEVVGADDQIIARSTVIVTDGQWTVELPHTYTGEPMEATIYAIPDNTDLSIAQTYASATIIIAGMSYRPEGVFGSITSPATGSTIGGDNLTVTGTASGLYQGTLLLGLFAPDGAQISQIVIAVFNPYFTDAVLWTGEVPTNGYTGAAELRAYYQQASDGKDVTLASVQITITAVAG
ncbi:MAG: hypothetical protein HXY40_01970 [Chloroflexi bacterium]|nr:hypothetical protein [Chloroflexota bacterium]